MTNLTMIPETTPIKALETTALRPFKIDSCICGSKSGSEGGWWVGGSGTLERGVYAGTHTLLLIPTYPRYITPLGTNTYALKVSRDNPSRRLPIVLLSHPKDQEDVHLVAPWARPTDRHIQREHWA